MCMQGIVPEGEWDAFMEKLRAPLPTTFRINGRGKFAADLRDRLEQDFFSQFKEPIEVRFALSAARHGISPRMHIHPGARDCGFQQEDAVAACKASPHA